MTARKHIVWVCPGFAADEKDSKCIPPLQLLAKAMAEKDAIDLKIISLHYPQRSTPYDWHGIQVFPCYASGPFARWRIWYQAFRQIRQLHREQAIDGLHSFWLTDAALLAHWTGRFLNCPHWVTLAGQDARPSNRYLKILPVKKMHCIAVSSFHANIWQQTTGQAVRATIPWGIEQFAMEAELQQERSIDIIGVGNLIPLKDYQLFVELIGHLKKTRPQIKAVLIGEGVESQKLADQIKRLGLEQHLELTGALPRESVMEYMRKSKVLLHPSTYESFGFVLVEAMANGLHLVSRPVGIAEAGEGWWLGQDKEGLLQGLRHALDTFETAKPRFPHVLSDTVNAYFNLYQSF